MKTSTPSSERPFQSSPKRKAPRSNLQRNPSSTKVPADAPDVYQIITDRMVGMLEQDVIPWKKPWKGGREGLPKNLVSGKTYSGINAFLLAMTPFDSPYFLTFKQARDLGGSIQKGAKGFPIIFWNIREKMECNATTGENEMKKSAFLRYFTVFNLQQAEGIPLPPSEDCTQNPDFSVIVECETLVKGYKEGPKIQHQMQRAFYRAETDLINMPKPESFSSEEGYYASLFHEMTHSTGHPKRLAREGVTEAQFFGDELYSKEELIAEMGAAFLCAFAGISPHTLQNSSSYIAGWLEQLKNDKRLVIAAAAAAQKATDYIRGLHQSGLQNSNAE